MVYYIITYAKIDSKSREVIVVGVVWRSPFTRELSRRAAEAGHHVIGLSLHPGAVRTDITRYHEGGFGKIIDTLLREGLKKIFKNVEFYTQKMDTRMDHFLGEKFHTFFLFLLTFP